MSNYNDEMIGLDDNDVDDQIRLNRDEDGGGCMVNMENEKRMRREIANSNERRRMQSINAGFQSLRSLLPHHEGEKLSKAAILQQTAQYIVELEREKTHLLSQNCQLKRLVDQQDGGGGGGGGGNEIHILKKRKLDNVFTVQTISDSSDEGLGSMSPEPITLLTATSAAGGGIKTSATTVPKEIIELKNLLEIERRQKAALEESLRQIELQLYPERCRDVQTISYQHQEVIEHTDNVRDDDVSVTMIQESGIKMHDFEHVQLVSINGIPSVGQTQVVVCSNEDDDMVDEDSRTATPCELEFEPELKQEIIISDELCEEPESSINEPVKIRLLQPILEAAIKAEPKVEVKRINSPDCLPKMVVKDDIIQVSNASSAATNGTKKGSRSQRMYITHNTSRQNLETIVEAIRHLEGDQLFGEMVEQQPAQDAPLALTTSNKQINKPQRQLQIEMNPFLQFRTTQTTTGNVTASITTNGQQKTVNVSTVTAAGGGMITTSIPLPIAITAAAVASAARASNNLGGGCNSSSSSSATSSASSSSQTTASAASTQSNVVSHLQQQQQCRPGVIVVKPSS